MDIKKMFQSKGFKITIFVLGAIAVALLILQAGISIGYRKAGFSYHMGDNYYRAFGDQHRGPFMGGMMFSDDLAPSHGATGKIVSISLPNLVIEDQSGIEKTILINDDTAIRQFRDDVKPTDLKVDDFVIVLGAPNSNSQIEAKLIRIMPAPPMLSPQNSATPQGR